MLFTVRILHLYLRFKIEKTKYCYIKVNYSRVD